MGSRTKIDGVCVMAKKQKQQIPTGPEVYDALCIDAPGVRNAVVEWIGGLCRKAAKAVEVECPRCGCTLELRDRAGLEPAPTNKGERPWRESQM